MNIVAPNRTCPECGAPFVAHHGRQRFCSREHQARFHDVMKTRGKVAMPLALVWRTSKRERTDDNAYALAELSKLLDLWRAEDKAVGRNTGLVVAAKRADGWTAADIAA